MNNKPYDLWSYIDQDGFIFGFFGWLWNEITGKNAARESNDTVSASTEANFEHDEQMRELDYQNELQMYQDKADLFSSMGIHPNAIAQSLTGSSGSGYSPSGSSSAVAPSMANSQLSSLFASMMQLPYYQEAARNQGSQADKNNVDTAYLPVIYESQVKEANARMINIFKRLDIDTKYLAIAESANNSVIALNAEEAKNKQQQRQLMVQELSKLVAETDLIKNYSTHELIKMSHTKAQIAQTVAQTENIKQDTQLKEVQTEVAGYDAILRGEQIQGQANENELQAIEIRMQKIRTDIADAYGVDINSDDCDLILEAGLSGHLGKINQAIQDSQTGLFGTLSRAIDNADRLIFKSGDLFDYLFESYGNKPIRSDGFY